MAGVFMPHLAPTPPAPPPVPTVDTQAVQTKTNEEMRRRAMAQGRASTILTDPSTQRDQELNQQRRALG